MVNCDFCGKEIKNINSGKKKTRLNEGNYCYEYSSKGIEELYNEILEDEESD